MSNIIKYLFSLLIISNFFFNLLNGEEILETHSFNEKLEYFRFEPSLTEWKKTFGDNLQNSFGPVHVWIKCVDNNIRGLLFVEALSNALFARREDVAVYNELEWDKNNDNFALTFNGIKVELTHSKMPWNDGHKLSALSIFKFDKSKLTTDVIDVKINDWHRWHKMRSHNKKTFNSSVSSDIKRKIAISVNFADQGNDLDFFKTIEHHFNYHYGLLKFHKYHVLIRDYEVERLESIPFVVEQVKKGLLKIFIKPSYLPEVQKHSFRYQAIYENLMLLYHWQDNIDLVVIDLDEFLIINSENALKSLTSGKSDCLTVSRKHVICQDCSNYYPDKELVLRSHYNDYWKSCGGDSKFDFPKLIINPDKTKCVYVHFSLCGTYCDVVPESDLYILHFIHYYGFRSARVLLKLTYTSVDISSFLTSFAKYNNKVIDTSELNENSVPAHLQKDFEKRKEDEKMWGSFYKIPIPERGSGKRKKNKNKEERKVSTARDNNCIDFDIMTMNSYRGGITSESVYTCPYPENERKPCPHQGGFKEIETIVEAVLLPSEVMIYSSVLKDQGIDDVPNLTFWLDILNKDDVKTRVASDIVIVGEDCAGAPLNNYDYSKINPGTCSDKTSQLVKSLSEKYQTLKFYLSRVMSEHQTIKFIYSSKAIYNSFDNRKYYIRVDYDKVLLPYNLKSYLNTIETAGENRYPLSFGSQTFNPVTNDDKIVYGLNNPGMRLARLAMSSDFTPLLPKRNVPFIHCGGFFEKTNGELNLSEWELRRAITVPIRTHQAKELLPKLKRYHELLVRNEEWIFEKEIYNPMRCAESYELSKIAIEAKIDPKKVFICPLAAFSVVNKCNSPIHHLLTSPKGRTLASNDVVIYLVIGNKYKIDQVPALFWWLSLLNNEKEDSRLTSDIVIFGDNCRGESSDTETYSAFEQGYCRDNIMEIFQSLKKTFPTIKFTLARINYKHRANLAMKVYYALKNLYQVLPNKKIFFKIDYDTIVFPRRLQNYINTLASTTDLDNVPLYFGTTHDYLPYTLSWAQGGAGYGINIKALKLFVSSDAPTDHFGYGTSEDYNLWKVLSLANVTLLHCAGFFSNIKNVDRNGWHFNHGITFHRIKDSTWLNENGQILASKYYEELKVDLTDRVTNY